MTSLMDVIIEEAAKRYSNISLIELLMEENLMARLSYMGRYDTTAKRLHTILRSALERKLR